MGSASSANLLPLSLASQADLEKRRSIVLDRTFLLPGKVAYFRPEDTKWRTVCLCCGRAQHDIQWTAEWANAEELCTPILGWRSMELHFPNIIMPACLDAATNLGL